MPDLFFGASDFTFKLPPGKTGTITATFIGPHVKHVEIIRPDVPEISVLPGCPEGTSTHTLAENSESETVTVRVAAYYSQRKCRSGSSYGELPFIISPSSISPNAIFENGEGDTVQIVVAIDDEAGMGHRKYGFLVGLILVVVVGLLSTIPHIFTDEEEDTGF